MIKLLYVSKLDCSESERQSSTSSADDSARQMRRITVSPSPASADATYEDQDSIEEVEATLSNLDNEFDDTEQALSSWSSSATTRPYSSGTGSYTGSPSYISLPLYSTQDARIRLSRITEKTEESQSRPVSGADTFPRRSAAMSPTHSRSSTDPGSDRELPPPGRANQLIAVFESNSPLRTGSAPGGQRASSPYLPQSTMGSTFYSRPSSPTKSSGTAPSGTLSTLLSPPVRPSTVTGSSYTPTTTFSTLDQSRQYTTTDTYSATTPSRTPPSTLRRPGISPRSPLTSVRNIVALWKERTPTRTTAKSVSSAESITSPVPVDRPEGLFEIRRRASARLRPRNETRDSDNFETRTDLGELTGIDGETVCLLVFRSASFSYQIAITFGDVVLS